MAHRHSPRIITSGLTALFDCNNVKCTSPGKSRMMDLIGYKNFRVDTSAIVSGTPNYLDATTTHLAKRQDSGGDIALGLNSTIICWSMVNSSTSNWRTLVRGYGNDHPIIIETGGNTIGYYDSSVAAFMSSGGSITSVTDYSTTYNSYEVVFSSSSPYWSLYINGSSSALGTITNSEVTNNSGFTIGSIGGYTTDQDGAVSSGNSQFFGRIAYIMFYNKSLSSFERLYNYNALKQRFGK